MSTDPNDYRNPTTGACGATPGSNSQTFEYDHLSRLTSAQGPFGENGANATLAYDYSEIGNIRCNPELSACSQTSPNYTYPASGVGSVRPHAVTDAGGTSYGYDANGNMTSGAGRTIEYNQENRLVKVTIGSSITQFTYDAGGGRVKKSSGGVTTVYVSSLYECVIGAAGTACTKYISAGGQRIAMKDATSTLYFHGDHLGSTNIITEKQPDGSVQIAQALYYSPFGKTRPGSTNPAGGTRYRYTGQEIDSETVDANGNALYNYGARLYDPALGRFVMADSIVPNPKNPQSLNRYSYVRNNPINLVDPSGHAECPTYLTCNNTQTGRTTTSVNTIPAPGTAPGLPTRTITPYTACWYTCATIGTNTYSFQSVAQVNGIPIYTYETIVAMPKQAAEYGAAYQKWYAENIRIHRAMVASHQASMQSAVSLSMQMAMAAPPPPQAEENGVLSLFGSVAPAESAQPAGSSGTPGASSEAQEVPEEIRGVRRGEYHDGLGGTMTAVRDSSGNLIGWDVTLTMDHDYPRGLSGTIYYNATNSNAYLSPSYGRNDPNAYTPGTSRDIFIADFQVFYRKPFETQVGPYTSGFIKAFVTPGPVGSDRGGGSVFFCISDC